MVIRKCRPPKVNVWTVSERRVRISIAHTGKWPGWEQIAKLSKWRSLRLAEGKETKGKERLIANGRSISREILIVRKFLNNFNWSGKKPRHQNSFLNGNRKALFFFFTCQQYNILWNRKIKVKPKLKWRFYLNMRCSGIMNVKWESRCHTSLLKLKFKVKMSPKTLYIKLQSPKEKKKQNQVWQRNFLIFSFSFFKLCLKTSTFPWNTRS